MKKIKNLKMLLIALGLMGGLSLINCYAMEKTSDVVENSNLMKKEKENVVKEDKKKQENESLKEENSDSSDESGEYETTLESCERKKNAKRLKLMKKSENLRKKNRNLLKKCDEFEKKYNEKSSELMNLLKTITQDEKEQKNEGLEGEYENINRFLRKLEENEQKIDKNKKKKAIKKELNKEILDFMNERKEDKLRQENEKLNKEIKYFMEESNEFEKKFDYIREFIFPILNKEELENCKLVEIIHGSKEKEFRDMQRQIEIFQNELKRFGITYEGFQYIKSPESIINLKQDIESKLKQTNLQRKRIEQLELDYQNSRDVLYRLNCQHGKLKDVRNFISSMNKEKALALENQKLKEQLEDIRKNKKI